MKKALCTLAVVAIVTLVSSTALAEPGRYRGYSGYSYGGGYGHGGYYGHGYGGGYRYRSNSHSDAVLRIQANHSRYRYYSHPRSYYNSPPYRYGNSCR